MNPEKILEPNLDNENLRDNCKPEVFDSRRMTWDEIKEEVLAVELSAFGEEKSFDEEMLRKDFENPGNTAVLMRDEKTNKILGFTYAKPTVATYPEDFPDRQASEDTAYIYDSAFLKSFQGKGLVLGMMKKMEEQLMARDYLFMERDSADYRENQTPGEETYADKIRKNYKDRIVKEESHDSEYGPQVFFRIKLEKSER